ncbi:hypothetical protein QWY87_09805 [Lutimonas halocynthiae]|uniref:hypothetical protein n=1 Tax=Lutimonas halocynthiae TaxID=1446477 RepID=UPI0025B409F0|nr:hypothetical protein [Lutimonas halocynthiae]MDN3642995.1 hypothetical protein [Lutimonas halocynthiae]
MADITITLNVTTASLPLTQAKIDADPSAVFFTPLELVSNEDYSTSVNVGDKVTWGGQMTAGSSDIVDITQINHKGRPGHNVFQTNPINGSGNPEIVVGTVQDGTAGQDETYTLKFKLKGTGPTFHVDPIIKVRPAGSGSVE